MRYILAAALATALGWAACSPTFGPEKVEPSGAVTREVIDGDTLRVWLGGRSELVRLIGINSPESSECLGDQATAALTDLTDGTALTLVRDRSDRDRYGRLLRYVYAGSEFTSASMVARGLALAYPVEPDTSVAGVIWSAQEEARSLGAGMWADDACGPPSGARVDIIGVESGNPPFVSESVAITNRGAETVDLAGWRLRDATTEHRYRFRGGVELRSGALIVLRSDCGRDVPGLLHWCSPEPIWDDGGDQALLEDSHGNIVSYHRYSFRTEPESEGGLPSPDGG